ncbi:CHAT domain-containing protein, partial [Falsiroseomonas oryzae]|uniref:CHAT domain-containing protein n=1 Tax=Falsiroseomonas oryzae TaxID=2766473 RepID=UPI0022EB102D
ATRAEVGVAARLLGGQGGVRFGAEFTQAAVLRGGLGEARVVHLATHALLPGELSCLSEPSLMVSPPRGAPDASGAFIPASTLLGLRLDADLVILSACNTGSTPGGAGAGGEGLAGLARAFFFAGTRGILATHWAVDDLAAALLVAGTLERERGGATAAAALRGAQLRL